jgi:hypothetical protein
MDTECTYLFDPFRLGLCVQYILHIVWFRTLHQPELSALTIASVAQELVMAAGQEAL